jgi:hypothetical protein
MNQHERLEKSFIYASKAAEFFVRVVVLPATIGLFRPTQLTNQDMAIRISVDTLSWVLFCQTIQRAESAGWDTTAIAVLAIFFLSSKSIGIPVLEHLSRDT